MVDYQPFGQLKPNQTNTIEFYSRFPGQYLDSESGLYYNYFRDYDPSIGRYIESDPIGLNGGINTYSYAEANPVRKKDIFGLAVQMCSTFYPAHTFLCADNKCGGYSPADGNIFGGPGYVDDDSDKKEGAYCGTVPNNDCSEEQMTQCVMKKVSKLGTDGSKYNVMTHNCGEWAEEVIKECWQQCPSK